MNEIISLDDYRNKKSEKTENPDVISEQELTELEESIWQTCQSLGLDQFFINLFSEDMPEKEEKGRG